MRELKYDNLTLPKEQGDLATLRGKINSSRLPMKGLLEYDSNDEEAGANDRKIPTCEHYFKHGKHLVSQRESSREMMHPIARVLRSNACLPPGVDCLVPQQTLFEHCLRCVLITGTKSLKDLVQKFLVRNHEYMKRESTNASWTKMNGGMKLVTHKKEITYREKGFHEKLGNFAFNMHTKKQAKISQGTMSSKKQNPPLYITYAMHVTFVQTNFHWYKVVQIWQVLLISYPRTVVCCWP